MALKPQLRDHGQLNEQQRDLELRSHGSLSVHHSPGSDEFARLQEQLAHSLKREVDCHKKIRHLQEQLQLMEARSRSPRHSRSMSDGSLSGTPDILWDSELSQTSEGSPHLFQPALIVVSGSPKPNRKASASMDTPQQQVNNVQSPDQENQSLGHSSPITNGDHYPLKTFSFNGDASEQLPPSADKQGLDQPGQLAPSSQDYRGIRQERERPPPSLSPVLQHTTSCPAGERDTAAFLTAQSPASDMPVPLDKEEIKFVQSATIDKAATMSAAEMQAASLAASKKKNSKGSRARSNTTSLLPNWIRRKRGMGERPSSPPSSSSKTLQNPVDSIEEMFNGFVRSASSSIQKDSLANYIDHYWSEVCEDSECSPDVRKYRDAVWDLFQAETKFLTRFLQPLEQVYKGFLDELHFHGVLKVADVDKIFANLSELCELSSSVAKDLFQLFEGRSGSSIAPNKELILAFSMFGHKFNPVYQRFCVNFEKQRGFVRALEQLPDFEEYLRVCRTHGAVGKNDLTALLIAPMHHQCHYQLLLEKVLKYTKDQSEKDLLSSAIKAFVVSLKELEANIVENKRSDEMLELQETLCWPSLSQLEPTAYIPETLHPQLCSQPCSSLLASKERQLVHRGSLKWLDIKHPRDIEAFLFTDSLLLTQQSSTHADKKSKKEPLNQLTRYHVLGHPVLLNMLDIHDVPVHQHHGHLITLVEKNFFQQQVAIYSLQASSKDMKAKWLSKLTQAKNLICYRNSPNYTESDV